MKSIKETSKEWCSEHSNKGCKEQCDGCWQVKQPWGCEQYNMELAYRAGANYVLVMVDMLLVNMKLSNDLSTRTRLYDELNKLVKELRGEL